MENLTKSINLTEISYPVYKLGKEKPLFLNNICLYNRTYKDDEGFLFDKYRIVDDKNISGDNLAKRRLQLMKENIRLQPLGKAIFFLGDLIKLSDRRPWFIDSYGQVFQYIKSRRVRLEFKRIIKQFNINTGGAVLELEGISSRFKTLYAPRPDEIYAGVLRDKMKYILYGVYSELHKDTWRKI